ncbi:MAG: kelch repeat-containing protein [Sedimentisphaerales bacterium]
MKKVIVLLLVLVLGLASVSLAAEDTWIYKANIPTARTCVGGCVLDGKIYIIGGAPNGSSVTSAVEVYDPIVDTWTKLANMPSARCFHATCTFGGKIYVFGGAYYV